MLVKCRVRAKPNVLWCYKKELGFSSHKQKRMKQVKKLKGSGLYNADVDDPFENFVAATEIRYTYYKESHKVLGQTFGMLVLQDFESVTPNVLCRTIETIEGGGIVILLINTMTSLKQLYHLSMDSHSRLRTDSHQNIEPRFNERFILSLKDCKSFIAFDDELNILPLTSHMKDIAPIELGENVGEGGDLSNLYLTEEQKELKTLQSQMKDSKPIGNIVSVCKTLDQARVVMSLVDTISEKTLKTTVALTAGRGRGKSAALGLSIATAIVYGYSNIFVTAPSPENLHTLFEFIVKGLEALNYKEHQDFEVLESTNPDFKGSVVRVNVFRDHRQIV